MLSGFGRDNEDGTRRPRGVVGPVNPDYHHERFVAVCHAGCATPKRRLVELFEHFGVDGLRDGICRSTSAKRPGRSGDCVDQRANADVVTIPQAT
jgi:hypothetical protein